MKKNTYRNVALVASSLFFASLYSMEKNPNMESGHFTKTVRQRHSKNGSNNYAKFESKKFYTKKNKNNLFSCCNDSVCCLLGYSVVAGGILALYQLSHYITHEGYVGS